MVAFVLDDAGVEPLDLTLDYHAVEAGSAISDAQVTRHDAAQPGNRQAALPAQCALPSDGLDHRVDQHRQILRDVIRHVAETIAQYLKYHDPVGLVHLWSGNAGAAGSSTAPATPRKTGCPIRAIFNRAMTSICNATGSG